MRNFKRILTLLALLCLLIPFAVVGVNAATAATTYAIVTDQFLVPLPGAELKLYRFIIDIRGVPGLQDGIRSARPSSERNGDFVGTYIADEDGIVTFDGLSDAIYSVYMDDGIDGCEPCEEVGYFQIIGGETDEETALWSSDDPYPFICQRNSNFRIYIPFDKNVALDGDNIEPAAKDFEFIVDSTENEVEYTYEKNTVHTNGAGTYESYMVILCPTFDDYILMCEGFTIKEKALTNAKDTNGEWKTDDVSYHLAFEVVDIGFPYLGIVEKYVGTQLVPFDEIDAIQDIVFVNTYNSKRPTPLTPPTPPEIAPNTADFALLSALSVLLAGGGAVLVTYKKRNH